MLYLDFYHYIIAVKANESTLIEKLRAEFHYFTNLAALPHDTLIEVFQENPPEIPSLVAVKLLEHAAIYSMGTQKHVDYFGEALLIEDKAEKKIRIYSLNPARLFELTFLAIHSVLGEKLDRDGMCRIHAVAVAIENVNAIVMLPSKGGKSTLLKFLLQNPDVKIISDDMPLCDLKGQIYPFPSKMSLEEKPESGILSRLEWHKFERTHYPPKWTASLAQMRERIEISSEKNKTLLIAGYRLSKGQGAIATVPKWKMMKPLLEHMIIGLGLPQVIELFLHFRFTDIIKIIFHAGIRAFAAFQLLRKSRSYYVYLGPDKEYNAQLLMDLIYEHQGS